ncbi:hypothetical protein J6590_049295 [Homalodisca vitripennis]|nr:hypothetical protein J6590_094349 [Homalodisca vitripennis]KAG8252751.1 hypothetical protein J6590_049295 [Homalodisca vitripennis]
MRSLTYTQIARLIPYLPIFIQSSQLPPYSCAICCYPIHSALFCPSSWVTGLCEDLIKQNKGESRYSTRLIVLIKNAPVTDRI